MVMKCPHCGAELSDNARFCKYCGKPVEGNVSVPEKKEKKSGPGKKIVTAVFLLALLGGGWAGYKYYFAGGDHAEQDAPAQEPAPETVADEGKAADVPDAGAEKKVEPEIMNGVLEKVRQAAAAEDHSNKSDRSHVVL